MVFLRMIALPNLLSELRVLQPASFEAGIFQRFPPKFFWAGQKPSRGFA
jgi:hypothetical protein